MPRVRVLLADGESVGFAFAPYVLPGIVMVSW
jgi:hypothetical protein